MLEIVDFGAAALCFEQHGERTVFFRNDGADRVHDDAELERFCCHRFLTYLSFERDAPNYTAKTAVSARFRTIFRIVASVVAGLMSIW